MRAYVQEATAEQLTGEMGSGATNIAEIVTEIRGKLPVLGTPPVLDPEQARFRLFDSITTFLKNAAQRQPLMLVLDDLHWADRSSLLLLEFLAREIGTSRLLLVCSYRDVEVSRRHPLSQTLGTLVREQIFHRVQLDGLTQQEVGELVEGSAGITLPLEAAEVIHKRTDGNPFFIGEITRQVTLDHITGDQGWSSVIPEGVRDAIGRRLNRLSDRCNQMLTTAAVIGQECEFRLLNSLMGDTPEDQFLAAMDETVGAHLIEELPRSVGRYQFTHALIRETLLEELSTTRRVRLHARISLALEELYGDGAKIHAAELAHHFSEAQTELGADKLARYSLMAGERALAAYAYEDALAHFESGLVARDISLSGTEAASDEEAAALLFGLARGQSATFEGRQLGEVFATISRAFEYYAEAGNVALAVAAAEFPFAPSFFQIPGVAQLIARALTLVPAESHEAGRLLSRYGGVLGGAENDYEGAEQALGRAIAIARREGDLPLEAQALADAAGVSGRHLHWQDSVDHGLRAIELAIGDESPFSALAPRFSIVSSLLRMGELDAARPQALVLRDMVERRSTPRSFAVGLSHIASLSCLEGDWRAGREYSDRAMEVSPLHISLLLARVMLENETGESAQGEVYLHGLLEAMYRPGPGQLSASVKASIAIPAIARITGVQDRLEIAEATAEEVLSARSVTPRDAMDAKVGLALLAVSKNDQSAAAEHYAYLQGHRGTMIETVSSVDRLLGLLSQTMGNLDQAMAHFEEALTFCRKAGYRPELAWSCCDYADLLRERNAEGNRAEAISLLDESLAISS